MDNACARVATHATTATTVSSMLCAQKTDTWKTESVCAETDTICKVADACPAKTTNAPSTCTSMGTGAFAIWGTRRTKLASVDSPICVLPTAKRTKTECACVAPDSEKSDRECAVSATPEPSTLVVNAAIHAE